MRPAALRLLTPAKTRWSYRGTGYSVATGNSTDFSIDIGKSFSDRLVVVGVGFQNAAGITSIIVDPAGANVTMTQDVLTATGNSAGVYSVLVPAGEGPKIIRLTLVSGSFLNRGIHVWTLTGLASNVKKQTAVIPSTQSTTIAVDSGDVLFGLAYRSANTRIGGSPEHPVVQRTNNAVHCQEMLTGSTATYTLTNSANIDAAFVTYR